MRGGCEVNEDKGLFRRESEYKQGERDHCDCDCDPFNLCPTNKVRWVAKDDALGPLVSPNPTFQPLGWGRYDTT